MALIKPRTGTAAKSGGAMARFQYRPRTAEEMRQRANRPTGSRDSFFNQGVEFFTPKAGDNTVRILPPTWDDARHYGVDIFIHYGIGADESAYLCLDKMRAEPCPLCEERARASAAGEEELADALRPRSRVAVWVIDRTQEGKGPLVWNMPATLDKDISNVCVDKQTQDVYAVDDPNEGYDVSFKREGMDQRTKYTGVQVARRTSPLSEDADIAQKWLDFIAGHPLPTVLQYRDYDTIRAAYAGQAPPKAKEGSGGAPAASSAARGGSSARAALHAPVESPATPAAPTGARIPRRGAAAAPAPPPTNEGGGTEEALPTWDEVHMLDEEALSGVIEDFSLEAPEDGFGATVEAQDWVCEQLGIPRPAPKAWAPAAAAAKGSWKDRLRQMANK